MVLGDQVTVSTLTMVDAAVGGGEGDRDLGVDGWPVGGGANGSTKAVRKRGRPRGTGSARRRAARTGRSPERISWALELDGDVLIVRIPLSVFAGQIVREVLERM